MCGQRLDFRRLYYIAAPSTLTLEHGDCVMPRNLSSLWVVCRKYVLSGQVSGMDWTLDTYHYTGPSFSSQAHFRERLTARAPSFQLDTYILSSEIKLEMLI